MNIENIKNIKNFTNIKSMMNEKNTKSTKNMLKKTVVLLVVSLLAMGCTSIPADKNQNDSESKTITVVDAYDNEVSVNEIKKAVVFDFGMLDIMNTVGVDVELAIPSGTLPAYLSKYAGATTTGSIKEPDLEAIFEFEPDVIFIGSRQASFYDQLSEIAPTIFVDLNSTRYMEDFRRNANIVAKLFHKEEEVDKELNAIDKLVENTKDLASDLEEKALIILTNDGSVSAYGAGSRFGLIHDVLGVKQADAKIVASTHGQEANFEYISQVDPDILFVVDRTTVVGGSNDASSTLNNDLVNQTKAAKNGRIVYLNPEAWYLSGGGIESVKTMINEIKDAIAK